MSILSNVGTSLMNRGISMLSGMAQNFITSKLNELAGALGMELPIGLLGETPLGIKTYFSGMEETFGVDYAEHAMISGKPRLQAMGDKINEIKWTLVLHAGICDPETELLNLKAAMSDHIALPFILANGDYKGRFVITALTTSYKQTMRDGTVIWLEASITLREYIDPPTLVEATPSKPAVATQNSQGQPPARTVNSPTTPRSGTRPVTRNAQ